MSDLQEMLPDGGEAPGGVLTGGQIHAEHLDALVSHGCRVVVNLRPPEEAGQWAQEAAEVEGRGLRYVVLPVAGAQGVHLENAQQLAAVIASASPGPVFVHCASSNRVGALFALIARHLDGRSETEALEIGRRAGLRGLEAHVRAQL